MSWSTDLFRTINQRRAKPNSLDPLMVFCAEWLIIVMGGWTALYLMLLVLDGQDVAFRLLFLQFAATWIIAIATNYLLALGLKQARPIVLDTKTVQLITPLHTWKSFPSDHTTSAWLLAGILLVHGSPFWGMFLIIPACLVSVARVYVGVHYPRDILGGFLIAWGFVMLSPYIRDALALPIYDWIVM